MRAAIARAADGPAPTLVIDGTSIGRRVERESLPELILPVRAQAASRRPDVGAKTIVLLGAEGDRVELAFLQGLPDGSIDLTITVCANSAACAVTVARDVWGLLPSGSALAAAMGAATFGFDEEVGAA